MKHRTLDEMISYFNQQVSLMDIKPEDKIKLLGMITAIGYKVQKHEWIPCSERLPNDNDYIGCMECLDGAVWYFTKNGTMGLGYYYESTKEWATTDDLRTDGKVIAWMPLPEPYREVEHE